MRTRPTSTETLKLKCKISTPVESKRQGHKRLFPCSGISVHCVKCTDVIGVIKSRWPTARKWLGTSEDREDPGKKKGRDASRQGEETGGARQKRGNAI